MTKDTETVTLRVSSGTSGAETASHDPLCSFEVYHTVDVCECDIIAKVRADERVQAARRAELCANKFKARDFNDGVDACVAAVRGES